MLIKAAYQDSIELFTHVMRGPLETFTIDHLAEQLEKFSIPLLEHCLNDATLLLPSSLDLPITHRSPINATEQVQHAVLVMLLLRKTVAELTRIKEPLKWHELLRHPFAPKTGDLVELPDDALRAKLLVKPQVLSVWLLTYGDVLLIVRLAPGPRQSTQPLVFADLPLLATDAAIVYPKQHALDEFDVDSSGVFLRVTCHTRAWFGTFQFPSKPALLECKNLIDSRKHAIQKRKTNVVKQMLGTSFFEATLQ